MLHESGLKKKKKKKIKPKHPTINFNVYISFILNRSKEFEQARDDLFNRRKGYSVVHSNLFS